MSAESAIAYLRVNQLIVEMIDACENGDKERLIKLSLHLDEDVKNFVANLLDAAEVTDEEIENYMKDNTEALLAEAASAEQIKTAKVKT